MAPAVTTNGVNTAPGAPVAGANSFTMAQAQSRLKDNGFTQVSELVKDDKSVWRGHAMKDGKTVDVAVDYKGNITTD
jgi:putative membrane protein